MNILLGDISSYKAIVVARFLKENYPDVKIVSFDSRKFTKKIFTKYSDVNIIVERNTIDEFVQIIKEYEIHYFFPVINKKLSEIWKNKHLFNTSLDYLGNYDNYKILNDKDELYKLAMQLDILVPKKFLKVDEAKFPYVIKPTNLSSSEGVIYVTKEIEIPDIKSFENIIIQQFVKGDGVGYSFYCKNGKILNGYGHKRLAEYPISGGSSTYRTDYFDERMDLVASKIVSHLDYTGFAMFEFKLTDNNELYLLEVNPRIWGSIHQGLVNGVNYFENILGHGRLKTKGVRPLKTYLSPLFFLSLTKYVLKFKFTPLKFYLKNLGLNSPDVNLIRDPKGYLSVLLRKIFNEK